MIATYSIHDLQFKKPAKTSRNTLETKRLFLLKLQNSEGMIGYGEISPFAGLSMDDRPDFVQKLNQCIDLINEGASYEDLDIDTWPSIAFGYDTALRDLANGGKQQFFTGSFADGKSSIDINGLIWMASKEEMLSQVEEKIQQGYRCIKMKIGALDFDEECRMLEAIRKKYSAFQIELRVDANGAFPLSDALDMLRELNRFELHSIEQPIRQGNWEPMAELCAKSPLDIALDEELLDIDPAMDGSRMLKVIQPKYLIIKPGLLGAFGVSAEWIKQAEAKHTAWWITSALESNLGLAAIAQFTSQYKNPLPQGLGTGQLYTNNIPSPLQIQQGKLAQNGSDEWNFNLSLLE